MPSYKVPGWIISLEYPLNRKLGGSQNRSGRGGEQKNPCLCCNRNPVVSHILTELNNSVGVRNIMQIMFPIKVPL
jgi:hypothetical protein